MKTSRQLMMVVCVAALSMAGTARAVDSAPSGSSEATVHTIEELYQQLLTMQQLIADTQQQVNDLKLRLGADGMARTVGGMVVIPAGRFSMGDAFMEGLSHELPVRTVHVSEYYIDPYPVTQALWDLVYTYATANGYAFDHAGTGKGLSHPVHTVNWYDCVKWANARSERDGLTPVYYTDDTFADVYKTGNDTPHPDWAADGYRLPTEAEWEKAARGGAEGRRFPWADVNTISHTRANYSASPSTFDYDVSTTSGFHPDFSGGSFPHTSPVGSFAPNGYGLYDMVGNLWEWCWDRYGSMYYESSPDTDPQGPETGMDRVLRGGVWGVNANGCRVAMRSSETPDFGDSSLGFRLVRAAK